MIVKSLDELYLKIKEDFFNKESSLYIADKNDSTSEIEKLLIQELIRTIDSVPISFLAIRNIKIREEYRSKGSFKEFLCKLENLKINFILHDVVNPKLLLFLKENNYIELHEEKDGEKIISMYKLYLK